MKNLVVLLILALTCCRRTDSLQVEVQRLREESSKEGKIEETQVLNWFNVLDSIEHVGLTNPGEAIRGIDSLIDTTTAIDNDLISDLLFLKGDLYVRIDSLEKAVEAYSYANLGLKSRAARAGALIKLKDFQGAYEDLKSASEVNHDYLWNLGNYFEITHQRDSAMISYRALLEKDTIVYARCKERIKELSKPNPQYLKELIFYDRGRVAVILK